MERTSPEVDPETDEVAVDELIEHLQDLEAAVDSGAERREVRRVAAMARRLDVDERLFGQPIRKYTTRDMAEAFVGSVLFSVPLLVEGGVFEIAAHFLQHVVFGVPVYLAANVVFVFLLTSGLIYWADIQRVHIRTHILGVPVPRRLFGVLIISLLTVTAMMTLWGRVDGWTDPAVAVARIVVVWTVASFGAALGDLLPGESSAPDIAEEIGDFVDRLD